MLALIGCLGRKVKEEHCNAIVISGDINFESKLDKSHKLTNMKTTLVKIC